MSQRRPITPEEAERARERLERKAEDAALLERAVEIIEQTFRDVASDLQRLNERLTKR